MSVDRVVLLESLVRELVQALRAHVADDSKRTGVAPEVVCPCTVDIIARAASALGVRS